MNFNKHSNPEGQHALFSPSQSSWLRYDQGKIIDRFYSRYRAPLGTEIHEFAATQITLRHRITNVRMVKQSIATFIYTKYRNMDRKTELCIPYAMRLINNLGYLPDKVFEVVKEYVNDGIGYKMTPELVLRYSDDIFGTADAIAFRNNILRIHDLKTGESESDMEQLEIYTALFCLEYHIKPVDIQLIELRLYTVKGVLMFNPTVADILPIMDQIISIGKISKEFAVEEEG